MALSVEETRRLYEDRQGGFFLGAMALLKDSGAARDAVQDGFAQALVARRNWRGGSPASWRGDEIVATFIARDSALVFLRVHGRQLSIESIVRIDPRALPARYGVSLGVPLFAGRANDGVIVPARGTTTDDREVVAVLSCFRAKHSCVRSKILRTRRWFAVVANPSRP
jgi:hypothetical protein